MCHKFIWSVNSQYFAIKQNHTIKESGAVRVCFLPISCCSLFKINIAAMRRRHARIHQRLKPCDDVGGSMFFSCAFFGVHLISLLLFGEAISCVEVTQVQENGLVQVLSAWPFVQEGQSWIPRCDFKSLFRLFPFRVSTCSFKWLWIPVKRNTDEERVVLFGAAPSALGLSVKSCYELLT